MTACFSRCSVRMSSHELWHRIISLKRAKMSFYINTKINYLSKRVGWCRERQCGSEWENEKQGWKVKRKSKNAKGEWGAECADRPKFTFSYIYFHLACVFLAGNRNSGRLLEKPKKKYIERKEKREYNDGKWMK